ncbi:hypothetical protein LEP1GSC086_1073 [Leptospira weilii str. LNT 1234]|nr:hypothetical protein LEP1GSC086_1073 [Leptospira weilii str. LNT 1234]
MDSTSVILVFARLNIPYFESVLFQFQLSFFSNPFILSHASAILDSTSVILVFARLTFNIPFQYSLI